MSRAATRRRVRTVAFILVAIAALVVLITATTGLWTSSSAKSPSTSGLAGPTTTSGPPAQVDIDAAQACAAFTTYLDDAQTGKIPSSAGEHLAETANTLLQGAQADTSSGAPLPKWAALAQALLTAGEDIVKGDAEALSSDGPAAIQLCATIPPAAQQAGGYTGQ